MEIESEIDRLIFENEKLAVVKLIRDQKNYALPEAMEFMTARYKKLRKESPNRFKVNDDEYWKGFQS